MKDDCETEAKTGCDETIDDRIRQLAKRIVDLRIYATTSGITTDITDRPSHMVVPLAWTLNAHDWVGMMEPDARYLTKTGKLKKRWNPVMELDSTVGQLYRTHQGLLGRLNGLMNCEAFAEASLLEKMKLFMVSEWRIRFEDYRKYFRYLFGVSDRELYACLKALYQEKNICIISARQEDERGLGPFVLQYGPTCREALMLYQDPTWVKNNIKGSWFGRFADHDIEVDGMLARLFMYCAEEIDAPDTLVDDTDPCRTLTEYLFDAAGLDAAYPYIKELMQIQTRDLDISNLEQTISEEEMELFIQAWEDVTQENIDHIRQQEARLEDDDEYEYDFYDYKTNSWPTETATAEDIQRAIELLRENMDSIRKGKTTGKPVNAERILFVLNEIPRIFSLKSLYEIFDAFDTLPDVVRRDIRACANAHLIITVKRGLYCSKAYAEKYARKWGLSD